MATKKQTKSETADTLSKARRDIVKRVKVLERAEESFEIRLRALSSSTTESIGVLVDRLGKLEAHPASHVRNNWEDVRANELLAARIDSQMGALKQTLTGSIIEVRNALDAERMQRREFERRTLWQRLRWLFLGR